MSYFKGFSTLSVLIAMLLPVNSAWGQDSFDAAAAYPGRCGYCHNGNYPGAPIPTLANQADWNTRLKDYENIEALYEATRKGTDLSFAMPNCGGAGGEFAIEVNEEQFEECKLIIDYMLGVAGVSIPPPTPPTPPTTDIDIDLRLFLEGSVTPTSADE